MAILTTVLLFAAKNVGGPVISAVTSTFIVPVVLKKVSDFITERRACQEAVQVPCDPDLC